jgi:hypothetical protein
MIVVRKLVSRETCTAAGPYCTQRKPKIPKQVHRHSPDESTENKNQPLLNLQFTIYSIDMSVTGTDKYGISILVLLQLRIRITAAPLLPLM